MELSTCESNITIKERCEMCLIHKKLFDDSPSLMLEEGLCSCPESLKSASIKPEPSLEDENKQDSCQSDLNASIKPTILKKNIFFKCSNCPSRSYNKGNFTTHDFISSGVPSKVLSCPKCDLKYNDKPKTTIEDNNFECSQDDTISCSNDETNSCSKDDNLTCFNCGYQCEDKRSLKLHILARHTQHHIYKCCFCSYTTSIKSSLVTHKKTHVGEKRYSCSNCGFKCTFKQSLIRHIMRKHSNERPFPCSECSYATTNSSDLLRHRRIHSGKVFSCPECDFQCTRKDNLKKHRRAKHA